MESTWPSRDSGVGKAKSLKKALTMLLPPGCRAVSGSALIIKFINVNLKELDCQFKRKNSRLNSWVDVIKEIVCKYVLVSFCPEWSRLINAGEVLIIRTDMAYGQYYQEKWHLRASGVSKLACWTSVFEKVIEPLCFPICVI